MANVIFVDCGSSAGARSRVARLSMRRIRRPRKHFRKSPGRNFSAPSLISTGRARFFLQLKQSIARYDVDLRESGWLGVTTTFPVSHRFLNLFTNSLLVIGILARRLRVCYGETMFARRHISLRGAGLCGRWVWFILS